MATPTTVTQRAEGLDFVSRTGMLLTGVTGFAYRTGFYLTNSGSHSINSSVVLSTSNPEFIDFPSGTSFDINPGTNKFIPFDFIPVGNNTSGPVSTVSGPYANGRSSSTIIINTISNRTNTPDASGLIRVLVTGQTTGFGSLPLDQDGGNIGVGPKTSDTPLYPNSFKVIFGDSDDGSQNARLRWNHPATGYYFSRYQIEKCLNLTDTSSSATGVWTSLTHFDINSSTTTINDSIVGPFNFKQYGTTTGIAQQYTAGTIDNPLSPFGEYTDLSLKPNTEHSYRIKGQYIDWLGNIPFETDYVYAHPVSTFRETIADATLSNDVANGLISGSDSLNDSADVANVVYTTNPAKELVIRLRPGVDDNVELSAKFDAYIAENNLARSDFNISDADRLFSGVHFVVPESSSIGSKKYNDAETLPLPAVEYSTPIVDAGGNELLTSLVLEKDAKIYGLGGIGGNGGFTDIKVDSQNSTKFEVTVGERAESTKGLEGGVAVSISGNTISKFSLKCHPTAQIMGGGGGGGGGDPFFIPKMFSTLGPYLNTKGWKNEFDMVSTRRLSEGIDFFIERKATKVEDETYEGSRRAYKQFETGNDTKTVRNFTEARIEIHIGDISGRQVAGVGGGGRGYGISFCGKSIQFNQRPLLRGSTLETDNRYGNINGAGSPTIYRNVPITEAYIPVTKPMPYVNQTAADNFSLGGNGGDFGMDGGTPYSFSADDIFISAEPDKLSKIGGMGGAAFNLSAGNSNYPNGIDSLYHFTDYKTLTKSNFPKLVAHFDASQNVFTDNGSTSATDGEKIQRWSSVEDSGTIYLQAPDAAGLRPNARPYYRTASNYTQDFNGNAVIHFDGGKVIDGSQYFGLKSNPLWNTNITDSFEICYYLEPYLPFFPDERPSPFSKFQVKGLDVTSGYGLYGNLQSNVFGRFNKSRSDIAGQDTEVYAYFRSGSLGGTYLTANYLNSSYMHINYSHSYPFQESARVGPVGWGLHNFTNKTVGFQNYNDDLVRYWHNDGPHQKFYSTNGSINENAGLPNRQILGFNDAVNGDKTIGRAWMYSVAGRIVGNTIQLSTYFNGKLMSSGVFRGTKFDFLDKPVIGMSTYATCFYGLISDFAIFNEKLSPSERYDVYASIAGKKNRTFNSATFEITKNAEQTVTDINKEQTFRNFTAFTTAIQPNSIIMFADGFIKGVTQTSTVGSTTIRGYGYGKLSGTATVYPPYRNTPISNDNFVGYVLGPSSWYKVQN